MAVPAKSFFELLAERSDDEGSKVTENTSRKAQLETTVKATSLRKQACELNVGFHELNGVSQEVFEGRPWLHDAVLLPIAECNPYEFYLNEKEHEKILFAYNFVIDEIYVLPTLSAEAMHWKNSDNWFIVGTGSYP